MQKLHLKLKGKGAAAAIAIAPDYFEEKLASAFAEPQIYGTSPTFYIHYFSMIDYQLIVG